jgi:hypothetical protein
MLTRQMMPVEAAAYVEGWDACLMGLRSRENPYYTGRAWSKYRLRAWSRGWNDCADGKQFRDPRRPH